MSFPTILKLTLFSASYSLTASSSFSSIYVVTSCNCQRTSFLYFSRPQMTVFPSLSAFKIYHRSSLINFLKIVKRTVWYIVFELAKVFSQFLMRLARSLCSLNRASRQHKIDRIILETRLFLATSSLPSFCVN